MNLETVLQGIDKHLWSSEPDVADLISALIKLHQFKDVVEVGVFKGLTSAHILDSLPENGKYIGIDIEDHRVASVKKFFEDKNQEFWLGDSKAMLKKVNDNSADLIFLDGDHTLDYVKTEFMESLRIIRKNGIICLHDYNSFGVKTWVDFISKLKHFETIVFNTSENRGIAVIICKKPRRGINLFWFNATRNTLIFKIKDKIKYSILKSR